MKVDVSIITPFYKGNKYLKKLFDTVQRNAEIAAQYRIELILVNDSPDIKIEYDLKWCTSAEVNIVVNPCNVGIQQSRINGINKSSGRYIIMLDQDDYLEDNAVLSQMQHIGHSDIVVANGWDENPNNKGILYSSEKHQKFVMNKEYYFEIGNMIVSPGQCMIRKEAIPQYWKDNIVKNNGADDLLLWLLMFEKKCKWSINPETVYTHVNTGNNVSTDLNSMIVSSMEVLSILKKYKMISEEEERVFIRRFKMRRLYEGKSILNKLFAYICYPDLAKKIISMRRC